MVTKNPSEFAPDDPTASEYGGVPGLIQPDPHDFNETPKDMLKMIYATDPAVGYIDGINPVDIQIIPENIKKVK